MLNRRPCVHTGSVYLLASKAFVQFATYLSCWWEPAHLCSSVSLLAQVLWTRSDGGYGARPLRNVELAAAAAVYTFANK